MLSRVIQRRNWLSTDGHVYIGRCPVSAVLSDVAALHRSEYIAGAVVYNMVCRGVRGKGAAEVAEGLHLKILNPTSPSAQTFPHTTHTPCSTSSHTAAQP